MGDESVNGKIVAVNGIALDSEWRCEVVVDSNSVKQYNELGYRTVSVHEEEICAPMTLYDNVLAAGMSYPTSVNRQELAKYKVLRFLMVKDGESRVAELADNLDAMKFERDGALSNVAAHEKTIAQLKSSSDALTQDIERRRVLLERETAETAKLRERLRTMEGDIAKFRKEIGEQRWREITSL